jgi:hypothetical protein
MHTHTQNQGARNIITSSKKFKQAQIFERRIWHSTLA